MKENNLEQEETPRVQNQCNAMCPVSPREAILQRLEAEESHCISRLMRLREAKLEVVLATERDCMLFDKIHGVFGDKW